MKTNWRIMVSVLVVLAAGCMVVCAADAPAAAPAAQATPKQAEQAKAAADAPAVLPAGEITLGVHFLDQDTETFGDALLPVYQLGDGLFFVNPRGSMNDNDGQEANIGAGYRHLFPDKNFIVGGNLYYDVRNTELDNTFDQFGFGVEFLSQWVDARANYYLPQDDVKQGDIHLQKTDTVREITQHWNKPQGDGNIIEQIGWTADSTYEVTSLQHYRVYEQALEGFDAEIGALLPIPVVQDYADVKVFVGWYDFNAELGDDVEGAKTRLEVRALPSLYVDATWYEDEALCGSHYSVGARASVPFDLAKLSAGKNPFAGALAGFMPSREKAPFASRLTDMVIRDLHVRTEATDPEEIVEDRQILGKKLVNRTKKGKYQVLATDVIFVDQDNDGFEDGSREHPYNTIEEGVNDLRGKMVYVFDAREQYLENVIVRGGLVLWGNGCPFYGSGGQFMGNGVYPVVNGQNFGPAFTVLSGTPERWTEVAGFEIYQPGVLQTYGQQAGTVTEEPFTAPGIYGFNATYVDIHCNYIHGDGSPVGYNKADKGDGWEWDSGILFEGIQMPEFVADIWNNRVENFWGNGIGIYMSSVGSVDVFLANNRASQNLGHGLAVYAWGLNGETQDSTEGMLPPGLFMARISGDYSDNGGDGVWLNAYDYDMAAAFFVDTVANRNYQTGISAQLNATYLAGALFASHTELDRLDQLIGTVMGGINLFPTISEDEGGLSVADMLDLGDLYRDGGAMQANGNYYGGVFLGQQADVNLAAFVGVQANGNGYYNWWDIEDKQVGWGGFNLYQNSMNEGAEPLADGGGISVLAMIRCEASDNAPGPGINVSSYGGDASIGVFMDIAANRNYGCGLRGEFNSPYGYAGALVMSSDPLFGLIENLTASPLLGEYVSPMDLDFIPPFGQVQMNDNGGSGLNIYANGADAAFAVVLDTQANGNGNYYAEVEKYSTIHAGIQLDLYSEYGTALGIVASTESLMGLVQEVIDEMEVPMDLSSVSSLGPVQANGNAGPGVHVYATGYDGSIIGVLGVEALNNGWNAYPAEKDGYNGNGVDVIASSYGGDAMIGLADVTASQNYGAGIHADAMAYGEYEAMIGGIMLTAIGNQNDNLQFGAYSGAPSSSYLVLAGIVANDSVYGSGIAATLNGMGDVAAALQGVQANGNAAKGIWLNLSSYNYGDAHAWVGDSAVADMNSHMGGWDFDLFDAIVPMLPPGGVEASENEEAGVRIEAGADNGGVLVGLNGVRALSNGTDPENDDNAGIAILANTYNGYGNIDVLAEDIYVAQNQGNGLRIVANSMNEAWVDVRDVTATENRNGVKAVVSAWGYVDLVFADMNVSGNSYNGLHVNADSFTGGIELDVDRVIAGGNDNHGIRANLDGYGVVDASFTDNELIGNGVDGLSLVIDSSTESRLYGEYNVMALNGDDGMDVDTSAPSGHRLYDFGGGTYGSPGMNSIYGNGEYDVERSGAGPFYIMNSYWGGSAPVYGVDYIGNNMQVGGWLAVDPNPVP